eukprot:1504608-Prymnesium_polylepis.1
MNVLASSDAVSQGDAAESSAAMEQEAPISAAENPVPLLTPALTYRPDVDGLRAVSVTAVV